MGSTAQFIEPATVPIAIIGLSCKFAGNADNADNLWTLLAEGESAWTEIPPSRFNLTGGNASSNEARVKGGHFLRQNIGLFDAAAFNFSAETASCLDPGFRLQLEAVYEALENAGLPLAEIAGSNTSVFAGAFFHDYSDGIVRDADQLPRFWLTGTDAAMASNRISHFFDFRGPSMSVNTGCSTTLVALHQAVQSLRTGESDMAVVAGSNILLNPDMFMTMSSLGFLSPDGRSYTFDSRANGYGRGEGVAAIIIKRLTDARSAKDPVRAVIRETALNQDGKSETITSPSEPAQEELLRKCYRKAGLHPSDTQYFEAHGTGTQVGDVVEARAIASVFQSSRSAQNRLRIGSVKTNIGHTEATSGLASLIKVVLSLEKRQIPPSINFKSPNPKLCLDEWHLKVVTELEPWPASEDGVRRASLNSFGYGGTNAHVILEGGDRVDNPMNTATGKQWTATAATPILNARSDSKHEHRRYDQPDEAVRASTPRLDETKLLVLSAREELVCQEMVANLSTYLSQRQPSASQDLLDNLVYTLGQRRSRFAWIAAQPIRINQPLEHTIKQLQSRLFAAKYSSSSPLRIGMVFTGQGAQWHAMGRELITTYPTFRRSLDESDGHLRALGAGWSVLEELSRDADSSRVYDTAIGIPICVALQIALVRLLWSWNIRPTTVASHSSGEIAAACAVGAISHFAAIAIAYNRSVLSAALNLGGSVESGMTALAVGHEDAVRYINQLTSGAVTVACMNSPRSTTLSGDLAGLQEIERLAQTDGVFARRLRVGLGYHSVHMEPICHAYRAKLAELLVTEEEDDGPEQFTAFFSPLTGQRIPDLRQLRNPEHWAAGLVKPVAFDDAFGEMILDKTHFPGGSIDTIIEIGPHTALGAPIQEILEMPEFGDFRPSYHGCLVRNTNAQESMQKLAADLLCKGHPVDVAAVNLSTGLERTPLTDLPQYPWNHKSRYWQESRLNKAIRSRTTASHSLLGSVICDANPFSPSWRQRLSTSDNPWLMDHVVQSSMVYPAAGMICLAIEAVRQADANAYAANDGNGKPLAAAGYRVKDFEITQALVIPNDGEGTTEIHTVLRQEHRKHDSSNGWRIFEIFSVGSDNQWSQHASGLVMAQPKSITEPNVNSATRSGGQSRGYTRHLSPKDFYAMLRSIGINHGPSFRNISSITKDSKGEKSICTVTIPESTHSIQRAPDYLIHPTVLDAILVSAYATIAGMGDGRLVPQVPVEIDELWITHDISRAAGHIFKADMSSQSRHNNSGLLNANLSLTDSRPGLHVRDGNVVLQVRGARCKALGGPMPSPSSAVTSAAVCSKTEWALDIDLVNTALSTALASQLQHRVSEEDKTDNVRLQRVCIYFIQTAVSELGDTPVSGHFARHLVWMRKQLRLAESGGGGSSCEQWLIDSDAERQRQIQEATGNGENGEMICRLGPRLAEILCGRITPLQLMMEDELLYRFYQHNPLFSRSAANASEILAHIAHKRPRMRILEIGAGTGGTTSRCLDVFGDTRSGRPSAELYHFTDVSHSFIDAARKRFVASNDVMAFDILNIEKDPSLQGFELYTYDVVIAAQVLHATANLEKTMANVRSLLKPGGKLLMIESTTPKLESSFIFGLLPGWWLGEEPQRQESPLLDFASWTELLVTSGFSGVDVSVGDCEDGEWYSHSTIVSTAERESVSQILPEDLHIITCRGAAPSEAWLEQLQAELATDGSTSSFTVMDLDSVMELASEFTDKICVFVGEVALPVLSCLAADGLAALKSLMTRYKGLMWVTRGGAIRCHDPELGLAAGFLRSLRCEYVGRQCIYLDLDPSRPAWATASASPVAQILKTTFGDRYETVAADGFQEDFEYAERGGVIQVPRLHRDSTLDDAVFGSGFVDGTTGSDVPTANPIKEDGLRKLPDGDACGASNTVTYRPDMSIAGQESLPPETLEVEVGAYGLNEYGIDLADGQKDGQILAMECAGIVSRVGSAAAEHGFTIGDRVMCLVQGSFAAFAHAQWTNAARIPHDLSLEQAASLPLALNTAYICLLEIARIRQGDRVLVHGASGHIERAALQLAQNAGADVFITVSSSMERDLLMQQYQLANDRVFNTQHPSFIAEILTGTDGHGVDIVLACSLEEQLEGGLDLVAPFGHFIQLDQLGAESKSGLDVRCYTQNAAFTVFNVASWIQAECTEAHSTLQEMLTHFGQGIISHINPVVAVPFTNVADAMQLLQSNATRNKMVLLMDQPTPVPSPSPQVSLSSHASYLIVGGLGGLGHMIAEWMAALGARNLIILSRSGSKSKQTAAVAASLASSGCRAEIIRCDVSNMADLIRAMQVCAEKGVPEVRGIVHAAAVLRDSMFERMGVDEWHAALRPKLLGTQNLHAYFRFCALDFFVMFSSLASICGSAGQANYAAGGSYQDALAQHRVAQNLPAVSINLGAVKNVGYVAEHPEIINRLQRVGFGMLNDTHVLKALKRAVLSPYMQQLIVGLNAEAGQHWNPGGESQYGRDARFMPLQPRQSATSSCESAVAQELSKTRLSVASAPEEAYRIVCRMIAEKLASIFAMSLDKIDLSKSAGYYGVDSLVAVDLRTMLARQASADMSIFEILQGSSLYELARDAVAKSTLVESPRHASP